LSNKDKSLLLIAAMVQTRTKTKDIFVEHIAPVWPKIMTLRKCVPVMTGLSRHVITNYGIFLNYLIRVNDVCVYSNISRYTGHRRALI